MALRSKVLKDGKIRIYEGRKRATEEQEKEFVKMNYNIIDVSTLETPELRQYAGRVIGGKKRSQNALTSKGKFIKKDLQDRIIKKSGVNVEALVKAKNVSGVRELFEKEPELKKEFDTLLSTGIVNWFKFKDLEDKLNDYEGTDKKVIVNNVQLTNIEAGRMALDVFIAGRRHLDIIDAAFKLVFKELDTVIMNLPPPEEIEAFEEVSEFNSTYGEWVIFYASEKMKKKGKGKGNKKSKGKSKGPTKIS